MPIEVKRFLCSVCLTEHQNESRASACEQQPKDVPVEGILEGAEITFINPVTKDENVVTYREQQGVVKLITTRLNEQSNRHQTVYFIQTKDEERGEYVGACAFTENVNHPQLFFLYPISFVEAERARIEQLKK
jgi:hypothetical protein